MRSFRRDIDISKYLPPVSRDAVDIQEITRIESIELQELWDVMCQLLADQFIRYMDAYSTSEWENVLNITKLDSMTLEYRKSEVLKVLRGQRPYTLRSFRRILNSIYGEGVLDVKVNNDKYELWITIEPDINYKVNDIRVLAERIVPLNLLIFIQELRQSKAEIYISGYARMQSVFKAEGGTISFDGVQAGHKIAGYARIIETARTGG